MKPSDLELATITQGLEDKTPQEILTWAWETYGSKLTMATAFGAEGCAIIAMLADISKEIRLFNLDTGYQFNETLATRQRLIDKYGIPIHLVASELSVEQMEKEHNGPIYGSNPDLCCHIRKVVPLEKAVLGFDAWISALRRDQTSNRATAPIVARDKKTGLVKINPLANWTKSNVWDYILANDVPYNPLHDHGLPSIGCWPCTRAVGAGEDDRAGRWSGTAKNECGLHTPSEMAGNLR